MVRLLLSLLLLVGLVAPAAAQTWPSRPVRLILPFAAGGAADVVIRIVAGAVGENLGQNFVVENRTGGSGNIGTEVAARAPADGYTYLVGSPGTLAINPFMFAQLPYDVRRDFVAVSHVASFPQVLAINSRVDATSLDAFVALGRARPGALNYGSSGNASTGHLITATFLSQAGITAQHVPFRGGGPAVQALVAGDVQFVIDGLPSFLGHLQSGAVRVIGITSAQRWPALPEVPAIGESVVPGFDLGSWVVLAAPRETPEPVMAQFAAAIDRALATTTVRERLMQTGALPVGGPPDVARRFHEAELTKWRRVVEISGARID